MLLSIMAAKKLRQEVKNIQKQFAKQILNLATSGFGLVAALAWNEVIQEIIGKYIEPIFGKSSGLVSLFIYALAITLLAVVVTYQLSKFGEK